MRESYTFRYRALCLENGHVIVASGQQQRHSAMYRNRIKSNSYRSLCFLFLFAFVLLVSFLVKGERVFASQLINDNFDSYTVGTSVNGQGSWIAYGDDGLVTNTYYNSSPNSVSLGSSAPTDFYQNISSVSSGDILSFQLRAGGTASGAWIGSVSMNYPGVGHRILAICTDSASTFAITINFASETENCSTNPGTTIFSGVSKDEFHEIVLTFNGTNRNFLVSLDGTESATVAVESTAISSIGFQLSSGGANPIWIDSLGSGGAPANLTSRIDTFSYATSTHFVNITGYWNATTTPLVYESLEFLQESVVQGQQSYVKVIATSTGAYNFTFPFYGLVTPYSGSTTTVPIISPYTLKATLSQYDENYFDPFGSLGLDSSKYFTLIDATSTVVTDLTVAGWDPTTNPLTMPEYECSISSITGCLKNAFVWLFYPGAFATEQFKTLSTTMQTKFPFAYVYGINTMRTELFNATSTASTTISLNLKLVPGHGTSTLVLLSQEKLTAVPFAGSVKTILGWILWLLGIEYIYYRTLRSHDPNTP